VTSSLAIVFAGTPEFSVPALEALVGSPHRVVAVYTQPDRPAGRGQRLSMSEVKQAALRRGLHVEQPATLRTPANIEHLRSFEPDLMVVVAYGLILPQAVLDIPRLGCVNIHASLLPRWRGAAPIQRAILAGDDRTGVTIMRMDEGLDTGPMLLKRDVEIDGKNAGQLTGELAEVGAVALVQWLQQPTPPEAQSEEGATYATKIDKAEARINWERSAVEVERQVRAFAPTPGAWFEAKGERIKLLAAAVESSTRHSRESGNPDCLREQRDPRLRGGDGMVLDDGLLIQCSEGAIRPTLVQRAGRGIMTPRELLRGFAIPEGTILS
jgi:methionyl-tRNA formyltransferase